MAPGVKSKPNRPKGPDRDSSRYRARPTATGGSPKNALDKTIRTWRPGKSYTASTAPSDKPNRVARAVAHRLTPSDKPMMCAKFSILSRLISGARTAILVIAALIAIAAAKAPFVSRGDKSGTNALELRLWKASGIDPAKEGAGSWYRDIGGGMGRALNTASAIVAYTISDRGTWLNFTNKG